MVRVHKIYLIPNFRIKTIESNYLVKPLCQVIAEETIRHLSNNLYNCYSARFKIIVPNIDIEGMEGREEKKKKTKNNT